LEIEMQDEIAIERAAYLMGVRKTRGQYSEASGRTSCRVMAVGGRMLDIFEAIRQFLTPTKIRQAEIAIQDARESGFLTKKEMRDLRKNDLIKQLQSRPGSSTRDLGIRLGIGYSYACKYLEELEKEGKVHSVRSGTPHRPRLTWYVGHGSLSCS
jgi:hypothetical protein